MTAYKGFEEGLVCRGYQFSMGKNVTEKADCRADGFHCAEDPLDCLCYYPDMDSSEYCIVNAGGDMDEDGIDTKISCTELTVIRKLTKKEFFLHALAFMADHPFRQWSRKVTRDKAEAERGYAVVRGIDPAARGSLGDILAFAKEDAINGAVIQVALAQVDGIRILPGIWYGADLKEREVSSL